MRVLIPDSVLAPYELYAETQGRSVETVVADQLKRFDKLPPGQRAVVVGKDALVKLDAILGGGQVSSGTDLLKKVEDLAGLEFHKIRLDFSPQQLAELKHRAERQGKPVEQLAQEIVNDITRQFFWGVGESVVS